jgi:hypothetical protein
MSSGTGYGRRGQRVSGALANVVGKTRCDIVSLRGTTSSFYHFLIITNNALSIG